MAKIGSKKMLHRKNSEAPSGQRRKVLLVGVESSAQGLISTFLLTMGWTCTAVQSAEDAPAVLQREAFDAVLIDLGRSEPRAEQAILKIKQIRPSLGDRMLVLSHGVADCEMQELMERHDLIQVSQLQQLWVTLQDLFVSPRSPELPRRSLQVARMIFDSFKHPLPAGGIRGLVAGARQLAYQQNRTTIDVSIECALGASRISLAGQVLDAERRGKNDGLSVLLVSGTGTLARTATNKFGEFHMEFDFPQDVNLEIRLGEGSWVLVPLGKLDGSGKLMSSWQTGS